MNDVRCFASRCGPVYEEKIVKHCEKDGVCGSDFGHILFQTGVLHTEANLMKAAKQMLKQHVDEHDERVEQVREEIAAGRRGAEEKAVVMPGDHKTHRTEPSFVEKQKTQDPAHEKAIEEAALSFDPVRSNFYEAEDDLDEYIQIHRFDARHHRHRWPFLGPSITV